MVLRGWTSFHSGNRMNPLATGQERREKILTFEESRHPEAQRR